MMMPTNAGFVAGSTDGQVTLEYFGKSISKNEG